MTVKKRLRHSGDNLFGIAGANQFEDGTKREIDFLDLGFRYKWLLLAGLIGGVLLGQAVYMHLGPAYEATTKILVSKKVGVRIGDGEANTFGERGQHIALIMSPMIVGKAVEAHDLRELPSLAKETDPVEEILGSLKVKRSAGEDRSFLNVIDITYRNDFRDDARKVVGAIVDAYGTYLSETSLEHTSEIVQLISEANDSVVDELRQKQQEYLEFRENAPLQWKAAPAGSSQTGQTINVHQQRLQRIEEQRRENLLKRAEIQSRIATLEQAVASGQPQATLEDMVRLFVGLENEGAANAGRLAPPSQQSALDAQLIPLLLEEKILLRDYGADHPDVQTVRRSIETLLDFYRMKGVRLPEMAVVADQPRVDFVSLYLRSLRHSVDELKRRDVALGELYTNEAERAGRLTRYQLQDVALTEDIERTKKLWQAVVDRFGMLQLSKESAGYELKEIAPVRSQLVVKRHLKFLAAGTLVGVTCMLGLAYLRTVQDTTLRTLEDVRNYVQIPVLGSVLEFAAVSAEPMAVSPLPSIDTSLCYFHRPGSAEAEAYRSVRAALFVCAKSQSAKVIQITSPLPGDGKTTFAANLALSMAQSGKRVLLIDADLRRPNIHDLLGVRQDVGLSEILSGEIDFVTAQQETGVSNLWALSAGTCPENPAERLSSARFSRLLCEARSAYDFVLVDTPPLLAVSDPCVVASETDGLLLVLRLQNIKRAAVMRAVELLDTHGANVLGVVVNGVEHDLKEYCDIDAAAQSEYLQPSAHFEPIEGSTSGARDVSIPV